MLLLGKEELVVELDLKLYEKHKGPNCVWICRDFHAKAGS